MEGTQRRVMRGRWGALKTLEMTYATSNINFEISGQAVHFSGQGKLHNRTIQNKKLFFFKSMNNRAECDDSAQK